MSFSDVDQLAINTIRLLAVSQFPIPSTFYPAVAARFRWCPAMAVLWVAAAAAPRTLLPLRWRGLWQLPHPFGHGSITLAIAFDTSQ